MLLSHHLHTLKFCDNRQLVRLVKCLESIEHEICSFVDLVYADIVRGEYIRITVFTTKHGVVYQNFGEFHFLESCGRFKDLTHINESVTALLDSLLRSIRGHRPIIEIKGRRTYG